MRTALFFIASSIYDCSGKEYPEGTGWIMMVFLVLFLVMDIYELSK